MRFRERGSEELKPNLTPFIDIIFQLLIFFVLTAKFIAFEGQLQAYLPKDRGLQPTNPVLVDSLTLFLTWEDSKVECATTQYEMDGRAQQSYVFPGDGNVRPTGDGGYVTKTTIGPPGREGPITYDYAVPDFREVERYLKYRRDSYRDAGIGSKGLPVEINFDKNVPWQMVVNVIDICKRQKITDISLSAQELEY